MCSVSSLKDKCAALGVKQYFELSVMFTPESAHGQAVSAWNNPA